jgi:hypothetical protein
MEIWIERGQNGEREIKTIWRERLSPIAKKKVVIGHFNKM